MNKSYWDNRAKIYNSFRRVTDFDYMTMLLKDVEFNKFDMALDIGCGTGIVSDVIAPQVLNVFSIDTSQGMIDENNKMFNKIAFKYDIRDGLFKDNFFDKIVARMVFHYILGIHKKLLTNVIEY